MRALVLFSLVVAARAFYPGPALGARFGYGYSAAAPLVATRAFAHAAPVAAVGLAAAPATGSVQSHAQDELGQYNYGYADSNSAKKEVKTADGVVRGSYSYIDSFGLPQKVDYVADALGFRVAATNLPVGPAANPALLGRRKRALIGAAPFAAPIATRGFGYAVNSVNPLFTPRAIAHAAPVAAVGLAAAPATGSVQSHAQDELGQYNYGYADSNSAKKEVKTADGIVRGSYSYIDAYGLPQKVDYVADALGFRVAATNLPVGPAAAHL